MLLLSPAALHVPKNCVKSLCSDFTPKEMETVKMFKIIDIIHREAFKLDQTLARISIIQKGKGSSFSQGHKERLEYINISNCSWLQP